MSAKRRIDPDDKKNNISIALPSWIIKKIDSMTDNRSVFIQQIIEKYLKK